MDQKIDGIEEKVLGELAEAGLIKTIRFYPLPPVQKKNRSQELIFDEQGSPVWQKTAWAASVAYGEPEVNKTLVNYRKFARQFKNLDAIQDFAKSLGIVKVEFVFEVIE